MTAKFAWLNNKLSIPDWAPTIADLLKQQAYATGQFEFLLWPKKYKR